MGVGRVLVEKGFAEMWFRVDAVNIPDDESSYNVRHQALLCLYFYEQSMLLHWTLLRTRLTSVSPTQHQ